MSINEPVTSTKDIFTFSAFNIDYETNTRKFKDYSRTVGVRVRIEHSNQSLNGERAPFIDLSKHVENAFAGTKIVATTYTECGWQKHSVQVCFKFPATKPSLINSSDSCWEQLLPETPDSLRETLIAATIKAHEAWLDDQAVQLRVQQAERIRSWAVSSIREDAKLNCRYAQRLSELEAGLKSEIEVLFKTKRSEMEDIVRTKHPEIDPRSLAAGLKAAQEDAPKVDTGLSIYSEYSRAKINKQEVM